MQRRTKVIIAGVAVVAAVGTGTTMALAGGADDGSQVDVQFDESFAVVSTESEDGEED